MSPIKLKQTLNLGPEFYSAKLEHYISLIYKIKHIYNLFEFYLFSWTGSLYYF